MTSPVLARRLPPPVAWCLGLFLLALGFRLVFGMPTDDWRLPHSASYQGDAAAFLEEALALRAEDPPAGFSLPMRGPGTAWLVARLWDGTGAGVETLRWAWCLLGAALAPLAYLALRRHASELVACMTGALIAASHPLIVLSNSVDAETPYLLLVVAGFGLIPKKEGPGVAAGEILRGLLAAAACAFRPEHALLVLATEAFVVARGLPLRGLALVVTLAALAPWERGVHEQLVELNTVEPELPAATELAIESLERVTMTVRWTEAAAAQRDAWPAFLRRHSAAFVAATVAYRGGNEVDVSDLAVLEEAFGSLPAPLPTWPPLLVSGPLNLALAYHDNSAGGFHRGPLDRVPPLVKDPVGFPPWLRVGLPPAAFTLGYLPHLELLLRGDELAFKWIAAHPAEARAQLLERGHRFVAGAAGGVGANDFPFGSSGPRGRVDMVDPRRPDAPLSWLPVGLFGLALLGLLVHLRPSAAPGLWPWLVFLGGRGLIALASFGYVRFGALAAPVVLLGLALALQGLGTRLRWIVPALAALVLAVDLATAAGDVSVSVDGKPPGSWPPLDPSPRYIDSRR